ncbi:helix-turn-helix transcriptional regulator [Providencia rettgeri]|uniref:helix-turn-helix domain-containing protein n=1 Tax=Providencia rettgeri TaxID=587 RepID=UPI003D26D0C1
MTITLQPISQAGYHIIGLESEHLNGGTVPWHRHIYGQLLYPSAGVVKVWTGGSVWMVHSSSALWLPPQIPHKFVASGNVQLKTVLVSLEQSETIGSTCFMTGISSLLRELLISVNQLSLRINSEDPTLRLRFSSMETLILQEIKSGGKLSLELPWPKSERLHQLCSDLLNHKGDLPSLNVMADKISVSCRTLMRLFVKETGVTFSNWIQQMNVIKAIALLDEGYSVSQVARSLGYASAESFGNMFKRKTGCSPRKFITS